jgi:hypothetical protein
MSALFVLALPVLAAAVGVFVASSLVHMVFKWHNSEYRAVPNEDAVAAALRAGHAGPGQYAIPHCTDMKQMADEAMQRKFREGPVALLTLRQPGPPTMGKALALWFVLNLAVAKVAALMAWHVFGAGGHERAACLAATVTFLAYGVGSLQAGIWMGKPWSAVGKDLLDAAIYAGVTLAAFWFLWP